MLTLILACVIMQDPLLANQANQQIYGSVPAFSAPGKKFERKLHKATFHVTKNASSVEIVSLFRNPSDEPLKGTITLPFYHHGLPISSVEKLKVAWMDQPLVNPHPRSTQARGGPSRKGEPSIMYSAFVYDVTIPAHGSSSLKISYSLPLAKVGLDNVARQLTYQCAPQPEPYEQFQIAIQWDKDDIFNVISAESELGKIQVGETGAFFSWDSKPIEEVALFQFQFYPNTL